MIDRNNAIREGALGEADNVAAIEAQPAPGYYMIARGQGVGIYRKDVGGQPAYYALILDLNRAAIGHFATSGYANISSYSPLAVKGNNASHYAKAVFNGTFFDGTYVTGYTPSLGLKVAGRLIGCGTRAADPKFAGRISLFEYQGNSPTIVPYSADFLKDTRFSDIDGVYNTSLKINPTDAVRRTWIALRDPVSATVAGEQRYRTAVFFLTDRALRWQEAYDEISLFTPNIVAQLDSSSSTALNVDSHNLVTNTIGRFLPYAFAIYARR